MLQQIAAQVRSQISRKPRLQWEKEIEVLLQSTLPRYSFRSALEGDPRFIFEIKRCSPSSKNPPLEVNIQRTAIMYARCGTDAISVLTEEKHFAGSLGDLLSVRKTVSRPLLRKDFIVDKFQISEALAYGADAVLLIAALLPDQELRDYIEHTRLLGMDSLVEIHSEDELQRAVDAGADIIGVNNRDLLTLQIDLKTGERLLPMIPPHCIRIAESGIETREDVRRLHRAGATAFLIGTAVMRAPNPGMKIAELMSI